MPNHSFFSAIRKTDLAILSGWVFQIGNVSLFFLGGFTGDWSKLAGGTFWIITGEILRRRGDIPKWFAHSCVTAVIAMFLTNYDELQMVRINELATFSSPAIATLIGTCLFTLGYGFFGLFSEPLTRAFKNSENSTIRWMLGRPRIIMGALAIFSMLPLIRDAVYDRNIPMTCIFILFFVGECLSAASTPRPKALLKP
jgi:hypothetical protein